jgi:hypothetical protein
MPAGRRITLKRMILKKDGAAEGIKGGGDVK